MSVVRVLVATSLRSLGFVLVSPKFKAETGANN